MKSNKNPNLLILGKRIRKARQAHKWTQEFLAFEAGIDRSYIGGVERGERNISFTTLCRIAKALSIEVPSLTKGLPKIKNG